MVYGKHQKPINLVLKNIEMSQINNFVIDFQYNIGGYIVVNRAKQI